MGTVVSLTVEDGTKASRAWRDAELDSRHLALLAFTKAQSGSRKVAVVDGDTTYTAPVPVSRKAQMLTRVNAVPVK